MKYNAELTLNYQHPGEELAEKVHNSALNDYAAVTGTKYGNASIIITLEADSLIEAYREAYRQVVEILSDYLDDSVSLEVVETRIYDNA